MRQTKVTSLSRKNKEECSDIFSFRCKGGKTSKVVTKLAEVFPTSGSMYTFLNVVSLWSELFRLIRMVFQSTFHNGALRLLISEFLDLFPVSSLPHKKVQSWLKLIGESIWRKVGCVTPRKETPFFFKKSGMKSSAATNTNTAVDTSRVVSSFIDWVLH